MSLAATREPPSMFCCLLADAQSGRLRVESVCVSETEGVSCGVDSQCCVNADLAAAKGMGAGQAGSIDSYFSADRQAQQQLEPRCWRSLHQRLRSEQSRD